MTYLILWQTTSHLFQREFRVIVDLHHQTQGGTIDEYDNYKQQNVENVQ